MKKTLLIIIGLLISAVAIKAQDIIILKTGEEISSYVKEISTSDLKYKKASNPDGPLYTLSISEVFMIKYENGEKDVFNAISEPNPALPNAENATTDNKPAKKISNYINASYRGFPLLYGYTLSILTIDYNLQFNITRKFSFGYGIGLGTSSAYEASNSIVPVYVRARYKFLDSKVSPFIATNLGVLGEFGDFGAAVVGNFSTSIGCEINAVSLSLGYDRIFIDGGHASGINISVAYCF